jgi:hypothetical protein
VEKPKDTHPSRLRLRSPAGLVLLGAALFVLLALVAAVSRAHHVPGGHAGSHAAPSGVGDYLVSIVLVVVFLGAVALLYLVISERDALAQTRSRRRNTGTYKALAILLLIALVVALVSRTDLFQRLHGRGNGAARIGPGALGKLKRKPLTPGAEQVPNFEWLPVFIAGGAGLVILGYIGLRTLRRSRGALLEKHMLEQQFESLLDETLDDLYAQEDPRAAIIAAYARMERLFATAGVARNPSEAPLEYLQRALGLLHASGTALGRLTGLFQRAKFSTHEVDQSMRSEAIEALTLVRDELRANREEDRLRREQGEKFRRERRDQLGDAVPGDDPFLAAAQRARGNIFSGGRW